MEEYVNLINSSMDEEATPIECIVTLKRLLQPRGYVSSDELKKIICDWIDFNIISGLS